MSAVAAAGPMFDEGDVQQVQAELSSPPPTVVGDGSAGRNSASSRLDRRVLIVEVGGPEAGIPSGTESRSTSPAASRSKTTSTSGGDGLVDPAIETATVPGNSPAVQAPTSVTREPGAGRPARSETTDQASSGGSGPASTETTLAPPATPQPTTSSTTSTASASGVAWEENFNNLDTGRWRPEHSTYGDGNGERQCYQPDNVRVANGRLILTARSETATCPNGSTRSVTSGMVRSRDLTFSPGQAIEFRVKLTPLDPSNQAGLWPAVWASSWAGSWPRGGELDFLEVMTAEDPRRAMFSMHYADRSGGHALQNKAVPLSGYFSDRWHTIRFDYGRNGELVWYLDGSRVFSVSSARTAQGYPAPFDRTIDEIKLNLAIGGTPGPLAAGVLGPTGATFEIDYIKVFDL